MRRVWAPACRLLMFAGAIASCRDASGPTVFGPARLTLGIELPAARTLATDATIDKVHVVVSRSDESVVKTLDVAFPPEATELPIAIVVPMTSAEETFIVQVQLLAAGVPLYTGSQEVVARQGQATAPVTLVMTYVGPVTVTIAGRGVGTGSIVSSPAGIACQVANGAASGSCSATFPAGTEVAITPSWVAFSGNYFSSWAGACSGDTIPCIVPHLAPATTLVADFEFNPCAQAITIDVGSTISGTLATTDCQFATGQFVDYYIFSLGSQQLLTASMTGNFSPELVVFLGDTLYWYSVAPAGAATAAQALALPAGPRYWLAPVNATANTLGSYRLTLAPLDSLSGCENTRTTFGLSQFATTLGNDCAYTTIAGQSTVADPFSIFVPAGKTLHVTVTSTAFQPLVEFRDGSNDQALGTAIASSAGATGSTISLSTTGGGAVRIWITGRNPAGGVGGPYTLTIDP